MRKMILILGLSVIVNFSVSGQSTQKEEMLQNRSAFSNRTLFQQFDGNKAPSAEDRQLKREKNKAKRTLLLQIIDTATIKTELKKKLQHDVMHDPFSKRLQKFLDNENVKSLLEGK